MNNYQMLKEYKRLNYYGKMFDTKRKFFETNSQYKNRLRQRLLKIQPDFTRTKKKLLEALKIAGFILDKFEIKEDYEKQKITVVIEMF